MERDGGGSVPPGVGARPSSSQAYFDRYPERKGQGPYIPSPKLTHSFRSKTVNPIRKGKEEGEEEREEREREAQRGNARTRDRSANDGALGVTPNPHPTARDRKREINQIVHSRVVGRSAPAKEECYLTPSPSSSSSSSLSSRGDTASTSKSRSPLMEGAKVAAAAASRSPSGYPLNKSSITRRASQMNLLQQAADRPDLQSSFTPPDTPHHYEAGQRDGGRGEREGAPLHEPSAMKSRLKAQQSMPNVQASACRQAPDSSVWQAKPWPMSRGSGQEAVRKSVSPQVLSIKEIISRHSPDLRLAKSAGHGHNTLVRPAPAVAERDGGVSDAESDASEASLDSIEEEIRQSMRLNRREWANGKKVGPGPSTNGLTPSPSTPVFTASQSFNYSQFNPARRLQAMSFNHSSSSSSIEGSSTAQIPSKRLNKSTPSSSSYISPLAPSSPSIKSPTLNGAGGQASGQDAEIQAYLRSKRLTRLMTLATDPHQGLTVSFADVGDEDGHPVFVFLGLGAVRYLVGLYDEMATVLRLRLICIDRWGLGKTDDLSAEKRGVLEWSKVVSEVADRLGIRRFSLLAHSAGAPYAMATCLMNDSRVVGPVHLLAPWVSPTIESGYKWLRYVPDGVIKTAQAADWKMQAWKLGLTKGPAHLPAEETGDGSQDSIRRMDQSSPMTNTSRSVTPPASRGRLFPDSASAIPPSTPLHPQTLLWNAKTAPLQIAVTGYDMQPDDGAALSATTDTHSTSFLGSSPATSSAPTPADSSIASTGSSDSVFGLASHSSLQTSEAGQDGDSRAMKKKGSYSFLRRSPSSSHLNFFDSRSKPLPTPPITDRPPFERSPSTPGTCSSETSVGSPNSTLDLTTALLRASHAESLRGGGTSDLLVILGRSSQKPWGFNYTDISHSVVVWHGDKDERISLSGTMWMEREMRHCQVNLVKGANHSLMTNVDVVIEALESISSYRHL